MPSYGLLLQLTHTGLSPNSIHISDVKDGADALGSFRKAGPIYIPHLGTALVVYTGDVAISFEIGGIRGFIDGGHLSAMFVPGSSFAGLLPSVLDEGVLRTATPTALNFVGAGVSATAVGTAVTVTVPGGGAGSTPLINEDLLGVKNGVNTVFTTSNFFIHDGSSNEMVYYLGILLSEGVGGDYVVSESGGLGTGYDTITMVLAPLANEPFRISYYV